MMGAALPLRIAAIGWSALLLAGCGASPPTTILTLDAVPPPPAAVQAGYRGPAIAVPAVHVPASLDRAEFVRQVSAGSVAIDDFARWAAPLGVLTRDALVRDLIARLPEGAVLPPGATGGEATAVLDVTLLAFATTASGATMQVAYRRLPNGAVRQVALDVARPVADPVGAAQAYAALLGTLADRIALDVAGGR